jgi:hypothetical protein
MRKYFTGVILGVTVLGFSTLGFAQTVPRRADGKPDLSGKWKTATSSVSPMRLTTWGTERWEYNKLPRGNGGRPELDPMMHCYLPGLARLGPPLQVPPKSVVVRIEGVNVPAPEGPSAFDAIQIAYAPNRVLIVYNYNQEYRQIYTDGRTHPESVEDDPYSRWWNGFSTGTWNGDTFVVTTTNLKDETWLDNLGHEGRQVRIVERFQRIDADTLQIDRTITDPVALAQPYTTTATLKLTPNMEFRENVLCDQYFFRSFAFGYDSLLGIWTHPSSSADRSSAGPIFTQLPK